MCSDGLTLNRVLRSSALRAEGFSVDWYHGAHKDADARQAVIISAHFCAWHANLLRAAIVFASRSTGIALFVCSSSFSLLINFNFKF